MHTQNSQKGITLLITLLLMGVLLGVSASLLNITMKQYQLAGIALSSETAFQAATAGLECILYYDFQDPSPFDVPDGGAQQASVAEVSCMEEPLFSNVKGPARSGDEQLFRFSWGAGANEVCSEVSVYKFFSTSADLPVEINGTSYRDTNCPAGSVCTVVQARGYNVPCGAIGSNPRVVEREYTQVY